MLSHMLSLSHTHTHSRTKACDPRGPTRGLNLLSGESTCGGEAGEASHLNTPRRPARELTMLLLYPRNPEMRLASHEGRPTRDQRTSMYPSEGTPAHKHTPSHERASTSRSGASLISMVALEC